MKKQKKQWLAGILAGLLCLGNLAALPVSAETAATSGENDTLATAEAIDLNTPVTGDVAGDGDVDYYKITLEEDGILSLSFTADWTASWFEAYNITFYSENGTELCKYTDVDENIITRERGWKAGTYYYCVTKWATAPEGTYTLEADYTAASALTFPAHVEYEGNDTLEAANPIPLNTKITGYLSSKGDMDYYQFTTTEDGQISLQLTFDYVDSIYGWTVSLVDASGTPLQNWEVSRADGSFTSTVIGVTPGTYYCKVTIGGFNELVSSDYQISANFTPSSALDTLNETEPNDSFDTADTIPIATPCVGSLHSKTDVDYYSFTLEEDSAFSISFNHEKTDETDNKWKLSVYNSNRDLINTWNVPANIATTTTPIFGYPAGTYYFTVTGYSDYHYSEMPYTVQVNATPKSQWTTPYDYETEPNGNFETASTLAIATPCTALTDNDSSDVDYYTFELTEPGTMSVTFAHDIIDGNYNLWEVTLFDTDRKKISSVTSPGNTASVTIPEQGYNPGIYYVQVNPQDFSGNYASGVQYTLTVNFEARDNTTESEPNDTMSGADEIPVNTAVSGQLYSSSDIDYYKTTLEKTSEISLQFEHALPDNISDSSSVYWRISLYSYDEDTNSISTKPVQTLDALLSTGKTTAETIKANAGTYYIKVEPRSSYTYSTVAYTLTLNAEEVTYVRGDVNEDGNVNADDAYLVLKAYASYSVSGDLGLEGNPLLAADVDENGNVNADDAYYILKYYATASVSGSADWDAIL
ncbi:dockerin type I domain-containing protein [uncultured Ruminococcus sp.]|uniref:dockerin type I domain-containing protein n=1 Tax=uncultured Ruminococcus sp. TaxID=165186 RepID=UPI002606196B|nr:dockerin type I domain-containing protein [uncultured Ruminococcus sp.]